VVLETGRQLFGTFLKNLSGGGEGGGVRISFGTAYLPQGRSGGILAVLNAQTLKDKNVVVGDRCVKVHLVTKSDNFEWSLVVVYGAAQDAEKVSFWRS
jgi:hypothetical protein